MTNILTEILKNFDSTVYVAKKAKTEDGVDGRIVSYADRDSYITEQYKVLRTNLYSMSSEKPPKTIVITSSQSQEGKTITSCNLAFTISLDTEKKTLLIDCDLRKPSVHTMFGLPRKPGFSDILTDDINIEYFLQKPSIGNLYIMPAGTIISSPSEILSSTKIKDVIDKLKSRFDYIIIDTPPAVNVTDASILGSLCDAVLLVVKLGVTQQSVVEEAFNLLRDAQAKPRAAILVNAELPTYYYYYKYKYYYKYTYGEKKE